MWAGRWQQGQLALPMEEWQCALAAETAHHAARAAKRSVTPHCLIWACLCVSVSCDSGGCDLEGPSLVLVC